MLLTPIEREVARFRRAEIENPTKEAVANQKIKINDLDKKVDELESSLRKEQAINKMMMKFLKDKFGSEFIERVESNL